ncbi:heme/hemin ABC transporter substrate-binding protein [Beutenbergia cavernae]|uniref:heme/hemin ABC transporter substrate-binding protein n=1 Tax=Beutenbergia cavernae TaxID=84757 RepID=UPI00117F05FB|nr:ABC transporter substrate-binding protein [Beutenbergia cavernae]
MSVRSRARRLRAGLAAAVTAAVLVLAGCAAGSAGGSEGPAPAGARLADVDPLADPLGHEGPSTATLADPDIDPLATPEPQLPVTVTDAQGTTVTVHDVSRILALDVYGSTARTVFELGLGENVVGRDTSSGFPEIADRPLVTANGHQLTGEAILELAPTLIITDTSLGPWDVVLQMRDAGIPVVVVDSHRSIEGVPSLIQQVADALGVPDAGRELAERTQSQIDDVVAQIAQIAPADGERLRMAFLYVRGQAGVYYMFGSDSGTDSMIEALGGIDVASEIGWDGMRPITDEGLVAAAPDLVLVMSKGLESVDGVDGLLEHLPALAQTPAGERRRVVDMDDTQILSFGPATAEVLEALAVAIYAPADA